MVQKLDAKEGGRLLLLGAGVVVPKNRPRTMLLFPVILQLFPCALKLLFAVTIINNIIHVNIIFPSECFLMIPLLAV